MNKSELINEIYNGYCSCSKEKFTKADAEKALNAVLEAITNGIKKDGNVQIVGFGTFSVTNREARVGVNPRTGEKIQIKASKNVRFKTGSKFKELL